MAVTEETSKDLNRLASIDVALRGKLELTTINHTVAVSGIKCGESETEALPVLPLELIIVIFEYAARHGKETAASLSLVSHCARAAVLPLLFRTLVLRTRRNTHALSRFLHTHPHIATHVRELWMQQSISTDAPLLVTCVRLKRLALTPACLGAFCSSGKLHSTSSLNSSARVEARLALVSNPHELLLFPGRVRWHDLDFDVLGCRRLFSASLTHLRLTQASQLQMLIEPIYHHRVDFSHLTHLAAPLVGLPLRSTVADILRIFRSLRMFVITPQISRDVNLDLPWDSSVEVGRSSICYARYVHDARVHLLNADGQKKEKSILKAWENSELNIWNCTSTHSNCGELFGAKPTDISTGTFSS